MIKLDFKNWDIDKHLMFVSVKNKRYAKENNVKYVFEDVLGKTLLIATKQKHPKLFNISLTLLY